MVTSQHAIQEIKEIVDRHYDQLIKEVLGDIPSQSFIRLAYLHSFLTPPDHTDPPPNLVEAGLRATQLGPEGEAAIFSVESADSAVLSLLEQLKVNTKVKLENLIRQNNETYKRDALQHVTRPDIQDQLLKESSLAKLKEELKDTAEKATSDIRRIALTELSNSVGNASVDRIIDNHAHDAPGEDVDTSDIFVYRIVVGDAATCKWCRRFYGDVGDVPKIYQLQTLLSNGSNHGKPNSSWLPVVGATHPNTRTSQIIEVPPGYIVQPTGTLDFVGREKSETWLNNHLSG